ncbi:PilZ domain-containing protein [Marinobacteraceae bacterium S3BR75-40.1]
MAPKKTDERRQFYRIEDLIGLEIEPLKEGVPLNALFEDQTTAALHRELHRIDQDVRVQIGALAEKDRNLASLIKTLNNKVDIVARIMAFEQKPLQPHHWHDVTLSEGGLAFVSTRDDWSVGSRFAARLTLLPELSRIVSEVEVIDINAEDDGPRIHLKFEGLDDSARQQLARHVLRCQARQRQQEREAEDEDRENRF